MLVNLFLPILCSFESRPLFESLVGGGKDDKNDRNMKDTINAKIKTVAHLQRHQRLQRHDILLPFLISILLLGYVKARGSTIKLIPEIIFQLFKCSTF